MCAKLRDSRIIQIYKRIIKRGDCLSIKELALTGSDLMELGIKPGPKLGDILNRLFDEVLDVPEHNTKEYLTGRVINIYKEEFS